MPKVLAQTGISLADVYDIAGSIVGVDELISQDVSLVHEMGGQIFSERLLGFIVRATTGAVAQNTGWTVVVGAIPDSPNRLLGVTVLADTVARVDTAALMYRNRITNREFPLYSWNTANDAEPLVPWSDDGAAVANVFWLRPTTYTLPSLITRLGDDRLMGDFVFRGGTGGFGAGTVETFLLLHLARANPGSPAPGQPSSHGLPLPGW